MSRRWAALGVALTVSAQMFLVGLGGTTPAHAYVGPGDDRQKTTPTGWWWYANATQSFISSKLTANNARLTDISVNNAATPTFTVTMVSNTGAYATPWWWYYGLTSGQVLNYASANNARVTVVKPYNTASGVRFAVIMVANTGTYAEPWWFYYGTTGFISSKLSANSARLVSLSPAPTAGYYAAIMVRNTSHDATAWWWYVNASTSYISSALANNGAYIVDLSRNANGTFNVVMYKNNGRYWWWYVNTSVSGLHTRALQLGARLIDVTPYVINGVTYYAGVMVNNLNALSTKLREIIRPKIDSGKYGFYLKQVNGGTPAALQHTTMYEPASALKVLYHAKTINAESAGTAFDSDTITYHYNNLSDPNDGNICPDNYATTTTTNLKNADTLMMQRSDNRMTRGILEKFTKPSMLSYASSLGMVSTQINHNIGCGTPHNYTTLYDLGRVYEKFQTGAVTSSGTWQAQFRSRMLNQSNTSIRSSTLCPIVSQEAASLGKSTTVASQFCAAMTWIAKGGSYQYSGCYPCTVSWDNVSMTGVPYKSSGVSAPRYFVFGEFIDGTVMNSDAEKNAVNAARTKIYQEALRPYIRSALTTW